MLAHELGHVLGRGHGDDGVMGEQLQPGRRATPEIWGDSSVATQEPKSHRHQAQTLLSLPGFVIDWSGAAATTGPAAGPAAGMQAARPGVPAPVVAQAWQQRFVNDLGASAERLQPNAGLRLHLPVAQEVSAKLSRL
ncbi:MAG: hypothetical protein IPJ42_07015 [Betaproteobacteria bacterium]|nr:hypothetical protein [Betaproteobacteria bacterium]MBP6318880.1 hypothetical protein [Rubrivivax sp.]MBK7278932.1 hypothetical protein [Betaproteobacteria bacterium]MBK7458154.1 hypothetical protein [Betaproteobacteria bacterium]MBK7514882.1 hypothetical protein [Betaproteobacteria bacterium]